MMQLAEILHKKNPTFRDEIILLPIAYCLLPIAYCLLLTAYYLLPTAYRLPYATAFFTNSAASLNKIAD
jgi:hypothetical protein